MYSLEENARLSLHAQSGKKPEVSKAGQELMVRPHLFVTFDVLHVAD